MALRKSLLPALLAAAASLSGCAVQGPFPSLAARPEEGLISLAEPVRPPVTVAPDPALWARLSAGARDLESKVADFFTRVRAA